MKIAIATDGLDVAEHFGRCSEYTIVDIEEGKVKSRTIIPNPGHEPGFLPAYLARLGVSCILAGGMGLRAQQLFAEKNIQTITGVTGSVEKVLADFVAGRLQAKSNVCEHLHDGECTRHGT